MGIFFEYLYPFVGVIFVIGYFPQIKSLIMAKEDDGSVTLSSWLLWLAANIICVGYAYYVVHDIPLTITSALNLLLSSIICGLLIYNRYYRFSRVDDGVLAAGA